TATDPAPLEMFETVVNLKPRSEWRPGMTKEKLRDEMWKAVDVPGVSQAWTQPIKARIDMLATGIRTPVGIKLFGDDLATLGRLALEVEQAVKQVPGTASVFAERITGGYYLDIEILRDEAARYGLMVSDIQDVIGSAIGGENITWTVERRERYPISVRYARELRDDVQKIGRVLVPTPRGEHIPLAQVARIALRQGPPGVRSENARLTGWIFVDVRGRDIGSYVREAQEAVRRTVKLPPRTDLKWSGQYEYMERAFKRLAVIGPVTLVIIFFLLYMNFRNVTEALIVMLSLPFALVGGVWIMFLLGYDLSVAVGVGFIALAGVAAETGVVMLIYLDYAYEKRGGDRAIPSVASLADAIREGAVDRVRPKMMTVTAIMAGLLPIMWGTGTGSEVMKRIAAPMVGGMVSSTILTLVVIPVIYAMWKEWVIRKRESEKR
ncbi:MAG: efflux RND transporter permease subunit, partial [Nitrospirae bacterium]|nr:efflux RND transporter permease subunit [Nitrospirota bacterium]